MICHERKTIFVHIQKTAGSSVNAVFGWRGGQPGKHFRATQLRDLYGQEVWDSYFKFAFVRNPWDRLVSWWSMIDGRRADYGAGIRLNGFQSYILETASTFSDFLLLATDEIADPDGQKSILRNQIDYLVDENGALMVDFIGRFETLRQDFATISSRCFGAPAPLPHLNRSSRQDYGRYYTPGLAALVAGRFARDRAAFGYNFADEPYVDRASALLR